MNKKKTYNSEKRKTIALKNNRKVIDEWFSNGFNGADAYKKVYKHITKTTTAASNFSRIQNIPEIKEYILNKYEEAAKKIEVTQEGILQELKQWVEADITETINMTSEQIKELPASIRRLINRYKSRFKHYYDKEGNLLNTEETIELQFVSKEKAIDMINKHIGFYEKDNKQKTINIDMSNFTYEQLKAIARGDN